MGWRKRTEWDRTRTLEREEESERMLMRGKMVGEEEKIVLVIKIKNDTTS